MRGHANSTDHAAVIAEPSAVDLVAEDELALTPDAATVLARIVRASSRSTVRTVHDLVSHRRGTLDAMTKLFAAYLRTSTEDNQAPEDSRRWQLGAAEGLISPAGGQIVAVYHDIDVSRSFP